MAFGDGIGEYGTSEQEAPSLTVESVSSVNQNTISLLGDANNALNALLAKVRGNQPENSNNKLEKMPERYVLADARTVRELAGQIYEKAQELHRYIGHDK